MVSETKDRFVDTKHPMGNDQEKRQPHERDETPDAQDQQPRGVMKQAAEDLAQGLVDTDARDGTDIEEATQPAPDATGKANPLPDRSSSMRDHDSTIPGRGKNQ
jgi:hypothetical protein